MCFNLMFWTGGICRVRRAFSLFDQHGRICCSLAVFFPSSVACSTLSNSGAFLPNKVLLMVKRHGRALQDGTLHLPSSPWARCSYSFGSSAVGGTGHQEEGAVTLCGTFLYQNVHCQAASNCTALRLVTLMVRSSISFLVTGMR